MRMSAFHPLRTLEAGAVRAAAVEIQGCVRPSLKLAGFLLSSGLRCSQSLEGIGDAEEELKLGRALVSDCHASAVTSVSQERPATHFRCNTKLLPVGETITRLRSQRCSARRRERSGFRKFQEAKRPGPGGRTGPPLHRAERSRCSAGILSDCSDP